MSVLEHLKELRRRLFISVLFILAGAVASFAFVEQILDLLTRGIDLIYIRPAEAFMAHIRVAFTAGLLVASPVIFYQLLAFLAPALKKKEKRVLFLAVILMFLLFCLGICFAWFVVFPFALDFFASFASESLAPRYTVSEYVSFATSFLLAFGFVFQLPLLFWVLGALGIVSSRFLRSSRKYALVIILILSAFITPPDVISQILMAGPLLVLYEFGIGLVALTERKKRRAQERNEAAS